MSETTADLIQLYDALMRAGNFNSKDELFLFIENHTEEIKQFLSKFKGGVHND